MRLRNISGSKDIIAQSPMVIHDPKQHKGSWQKVFENDHPIRIEVGMGKGKFIYQSAKENPQVNYIGIEKYSSVLLRALQKMEQEPLSNLLFIRMDAEETAEVFGEGEIDRIYLNFSDPWPKDRHAKRRLPSREFLKRYDLFLKKDGVIEFKTDNRELFDFALEELPFAGWETVQMTFDLHHDEKMAAGNIMTEYEEKFSALGNPICKYIIKRQGILNQINYGEQKGVVMEVKITDENFEAEVKESSLPVLVDFFADWCGPCKMMAPLVGQLAEEYSGKCKVGKCNVDESPQTASAFKVMSIPTFILFKDGKAVDTVVGAVSKTALQEKIKQVLA